jgi:hypothetical protein
MHLPRSLIAASLLMIPLHAFAQTSGGASSPGASPSTGGANPGVVGQSLNNSNPNPSLNPSVSGTPSTPSAPGTNSAGTAQSSGSSANVGTGVTTGSASSRAGGRVDGVEAQGPNKAGDPIRAEDAALDKKIKSICKGC